MSSLPLSLSHTGPLFLSLSLLGDRLRYRNIRRWKIVLPVCGWLLVSRHKPNMSKIIKMLISVDVFYETDNVRVSN